MAAQTSETKTTFRGLSGDFWKYWTGQTISNLGSSVTLFALPLLVYQLTGSAINLGITGAAEFLPYLLFGLVLGAWMDRVNRKRMMILTDVARAAIIATIPLSAGFHILSVWLIYAVGFIHSTLTICFEAGQFAAIPSLVKQDDLVTANGRIQASYSAASVVGPLLAGLLVAKIPLAMLLFIDASSFLVSAFSLVLIRRSFNAKKDEKREATTIFRDVVEGLRYVLSHPVLRNISLMMSMVNFVASTTYAQLVLFAKERLAANNTEVSLLFSFGSLGVVIMGLLAGLLRKRWSFSKVALGALMTEGLLTIVFSFMRWYWAAALLWMLMSGLGILFNINTGSLRQAIVPNHLLGRVITIAGVLAWSAIPLGSLLGGFAIAWTHNVALVYGIIGALTFLIPFSFSFTPLGHAEKYIPAKTEEAEESLAHSE
ncbi:MAG TPA: MFS transporter [Ktedonobacteraceae bacterium]|jgi:MFS family permease|nr:MFS transporter [Ktedonobacteraceae bacterium]